MIKRVNYIVMLGAILLMTSGLVTKWVMAAPGTQPDPAIITHRAGPTLGVWQQLTPTNNGPSARYDHAMTYANNKIYLFGGRKGSTSYRDVWVLDLNSLTWDELAKSSPTKPPERHTPVITIVGQYMYLTTGKSGATEFNDVWRLNLVTEVWEDLSANAGTRPIQRYGAAGGDLNGNLIISHGFGSTRYNDTWLFNTTTHKWEELIEMDTAGVPLRRCLVPGTVAGSKFIMHGGCSSGFGPCPQGDTWILNTTNDTWRQVATGGTAGVDKPAARQYHSLVTLEDNSGVVLFGGDASTNSSGGTPLNDVWLLDLTTETWQPIATSNGPSARSSHAAVWIPNSATLDPGMIVFGGRTGSNQNTASTQLWHLTLRSPGALQFSAADYSVIENEGNAVITVTRTSGLSGTVTVDYGTSNGGTATIGSDYQAISGTLTFNEGEAAKNFQAPIVDGAPPPNEGDETINLTLSNPSGGATLGTPSTAVLTIFDDDGPGRVQFSAADYTVAENGVSAMITVTRIAGNSGQVSVDYEAGNGTATAGVDYLAVSDTVTFDDGDTTPKTFTVTIENDAEAEGDEIINLALNNPTGGVILGSPNPATLTILDNDGADLSLTQVSPPNSILLGQPLTYTLIISNGGPTPATGVTMTDTLPVSATYSSAFVTQGNCDEANGTVTCALGELDANAQITATLVVTPAEVGTLVNHAQVTGNETDPDPANNSSVLSTTVTLSPEASPVYLPAIIKNPLTLQ